MQSLLQAGRSAARVLLAQHCLLCEAASGDVPVCTACAAALPSMPPCCPQCAMPSPHGSTCGDCLARPPRFDATLALWPYAFPVDRLVHALKFHARLQLSQWFATALASHVPDGTTGLVAMPLHRARLAERGFNQSYEVARRVARLRGLPVLEEQVTRTRVTDEQARLVYKERARNVRGAFSSTGSLEGRSLAVIDDVMTTGATLNELARTLKQAGAARIVNCVLARTLPP